MYIIIFGLFLQCFTIYSYIGKPNDDLCVIRSWITCIPLTIVIMAIFAQVIYIYIYLFINYYNSYINFIK